MSDAAGVAERDGTVAALVREMSAALARAGIAEAKREAGDELEGGQMQAPEPETMPAEPEQELPERSTPEG